MSDHGYPSFEVAHQRWSALGTDTWLASILLAVVVGACILFKGLELTGYPIWLWIVRLVHMSLRALQLHGSSDRNRDTSQDTMQRAGSLLSSIDGLLRRGVRGLTGALSSGPSNVPPGLGNISNSCYQNSIIQGLAALPSLRDYLSQITSEHPSFTTDTTNGALHELITNLNNPDGQGRSFWIPGRLKSMSTFTQQDAQEYYSKILDELDMEMKKASSCKRRSSLSWLEATRSLSGLPSTTEDEKDSETKNEAQGQAPAAQTSKILPNPLDGLSAQRVGCTSCGYSEGLTLTPFNCITVSLGSKHNYGIWECLDEYTRLEYIDDVECAKCTLLKLRKTLTPLAEANPGSLFESRLHTVLGMIDDEKFEDNMLVKTLNIPKKNWVQSRKSKQIVVARAPKSLVLHINRSIFDESTGAQYKNTASVSYPDILDFGDWCLGSSPSGSSEPDLSQEEWPRDPTKTLLPGSDERITNSPFQYRLRAVVTHAGTHGYGHYVCYRPHARFASQKEADREDREDREDIEEPKEEQWWRFSDDSVYAVPAAQAHQDNVFMLFYERLDQHALSQPPEPEPIGETCSVPDDAPLPPYDNARSAGHFVDDEAAINVPLPNDHELFDLLVPEWIDKQSHPHPISQVGHDISTAISAYPTPPPEISTPDFHQRIAAKSTEHDTETETSEAESDDTPSAQLHSDLKPEFVSPSTSKPFMPMPPHMMRTAGNASARGQGSRQSLPMVSAT